ncbi:MAG: hypothetical protein IPK57_10625 [Chitinophagaceae bacterium]|nr:hypothetical protein [Chitinophagaceae bacterium]
MIAITRYLIFLPLFLLALSVAKSQSFSSFDTLAIPAKYKPEFRRERNHELIDAEQKAILGSDGNRDNLFAPSDKEEINLMLSQSLVKKVDWLQYSIETDAGFDHRLKVNYLFGLENLLKNIFAKTGNSNRIEKLIH